MKSTILLFLTIFVLSCSPDNLTTIESDTFLNATTRSSSCNFILPINGNLPIQNTTDIIHVADYTVEAIEDAIGEISPNKRRLFFKAGTYLLPVERDNNNALTLNTVLDFRTYNNIEIFGEAGTIIKLDYLNENEIDQATIRNSAISLVNIEFSNNVVIHDLTLEGNFEFTGNPSDTDDFSTKHRNLQIRNCSSVYAYDMKSIKSEGDAITILAGANWTNSNIFVTNVELDNLNRNGISVAGLGSSNSIFITESTFGSRIRTQQIDFEPRFPGSVFNIQIINNEFEKLLTSENAVSQAAIATLRDDGLDSNVSCFFIMNNDILENDIILARGTSDVTIDNNKKIPSLTIVNNANTVNVTNNTFNLELRQEMSAYRKIAGITITNSVFNPLNSVQAPYGEPFDINFSDNTFVQSSSGFPFNRAVLVANADNVDFSDNDITLNTPQTNNIGIQLYFNINEPNDLQTMNFSRCGNIFNGVSSMNRINLQGPDDDDIIVDNCNIGVVGG